MNDSVYITCLLCVTIPWCVYVASVPIAYWLRNVLKWMMPVRRPCHVTLSSQLTALRCNLLTCQYIFFLCVNNLTKAHIELCNEVNEIHTLIQINMRVSLKKVQHIFILKFHSFDCIHLMIKKRRMLISTSCITFDKFARVINPFFSKKN